MVVGRQVSGEEAGLQEEENEGYEEKKGSRSICVPWRFSGLLLRHGASSAWQQACEGERENECDWQLELGACLISVAESASQPRRIHK
jgi:hypothetical protein